MGWAENVAGDIWSARTINGAGNAGWRFVEENGARCGDVHSACLGAAVGVQSQASFRYHLRFCVYASVLHPTIHCGGLHEVRVEGGKIDGFTAAMCLLSPSILLRTTKGYSLGSGKFSYGFPSPIFPRSRVIANRTYRQRTFDVSHDGG